MNKDKNNWYLKEFNDISLSIQNKFTLDLFDFLRIRNFKLNNLSIESEDSIKNKTLEAFKPDIPVVERLRILTELYGVRISVASTILAMKFPKEFAIIDQNVIKALAQRKKNKR